MTMTSYHQERWNPLWSVSSLLLGLQSFFYEESPNSIGGLRSSDETRKQFAQESVSFNSNNPKIAKVFQSFFPDLVRVVEKKRDRDTEDERVDKEQLKRHKNKADDGSVDGKVDKQIEVIEILD